MRFLPIIFVIISVASSNPIPARKSFNDVFDLTIGVFAMKGNQAPFNHLKTANRECMREKLKLAVNGEKIIVQNLGIYAVTAAAVACLDNPDPIYDESFDGKLQRLAAINVYNNKIDCLKQRLFELQPESNLLVDFDVQHMTNTADECKLVAITEGGMMKTIKSMDEKYAGMGIERCMAIDAMMVKINGYNLLVLTYSQPDMAAEMAEYRKKMKEQSMTRDKLLLKCTMEKIDEQLNENDGQK
jgi:hypothetical protein